MPILCLSLVLALVAALIQFQTSARGGPGAPGEASVQVDPDDVSSIDGILDAVYASISGPAGAPRQWDRFRGLMHPDGARLMAVQEQPDGGESLAVLTAEEYISRTDGAFTEQGFFETELHRVVETWGHVAHVWSTYGYAQEEGADPIRRGVNSYQLFHDEERWYVVSILWDAEREDQPLPARFLPGDE